MYSTLRVFSKITKQAESNYPLVKKLKQKNKRRINDSSARTNIDDINRFYSRVFSTDLKKSLCSDSRKHTGRLRDNGLKKPYKKTTPALLGIFSLVCLMAKQISKSESLSAGSSAWYKKRELTFSDIIAAVRRSIWSHKYLESAKNRDNDLFNEQFMEKIIERLILRGIGKT